MLLAMITIYGKLRDSENIMNIFTEMKKNHVSRNQITLNNILGVLVDLNEREKSLEILNLIKKKSRPDKVTFNHLIRLYGQSNELEQIFSALEDMKKQVTFFSCLLSFYLLLFSRFFWSFSISSLSFLPSPFRSPFVSLSFLALFL